MGTKQIKNGREVYLDILKAFAIFGVIFIHITTERMLPEEKGLACYIVIYALSRFCVPVFLMISGILLTRAEKELSIKDLFFRRILRILMIAFIYGMAYKLIRLFTGGMHMGIVEFLKSYVYDFATANLEFHFWYIYVIVAVYIASPVLKEFLRGTSQKMLEYFLFVWVIVNALFLCGKAGYLVTPYIMFDDYNFLGMFMSYMGFVVLGYYLYHFEMGATKKKLTGIATVICMVVGLVAAVYDMKQFGMYRVEYFSYYSPAVILLSMQVFLWAKHHTFHIDCLPNRLLCNIGRNTLSIYFVHFIIVIIGFQWVLPQIRIMPLADMVVYFCLIFLPSWAYANIVHRIPVLSKWL